jgi:hypothetical protein
MNYHHAVILVAPTEAEIEAQYDQYRADCDLVTQTFYELRIADARQLIALANQTPLNHPQQCLVVHAQKIAVEAQQALLKILEEPPASTVFLLILPKLALLPTVLSRCQIIYGGAYQIHKTVSRNFLAKNPAERLSYISDIAKKKDTDAMQTVITEIIWYIDSHGKNIPPADLQAVSFALRHFDKRGASTKMLLEDCALRLPVVSF